MKQKTIAKLVTLILLIAFCSCERDFEENHQHNQFSIKDYSLAKANKIARFSNANAKYNDHLKKGRNTKSAKALSDLTIDSTTIREISIGENYTTYTMLVNDGDADETTFKNLIIEVRPDSTTAYLVKYTPTEEITYVEEHDSYTFEGESEVEQSLVIRGPEWNPGTGGYETDQPGGGTSGWVTCTDQLMCRTPYPNQTYGVEHAATAMCISYGTTYLKPVCTTNTTTGGGNPPGGSGTGTGPAGGGTGTSGTNGTPGSNGPVTSPVVPRPPDEKKCTLFNKLKNDMPFKGLVNEVLKPTTSSDSEVGYALTNLPDGTYSAIQGTNNPDLEYAVEFAIPNGTTIDILTHTHYTGGLSIFSPDDLLQMYNVFMNHYDSIDSGQTFTSILVSPTNEVYAMTITDRAQFIAFYNAYLSPTKFPLFDIMYGLPTNNPTIKGGGFGINTDHNSLENEINFLKLLNKSSGIKLHKANADLSQWNPLKLNSAGNVELEPSCN